MLIVFIVTDEQGLANVELHGRMDSLGAAVFDRQLEDLILRNQSFALDFSGVKFLSSAGIRSLLKAEKSLRKNRAFLVLYGLPEFIAHALELSGLAAQLRIVPSREDALRLLRIESSERDRKTVGRRSYVLNRLDSTPSVVVRWKPEGGMALSVSLSEAGFGFGLGALPADPDESAQWGTFVTFPGFFGVQPDNPLHPSDYELSARPGETYVQVREAWSFEGAPAHRVETSDPSPIPLQQLLEDVVGLDHPNAPYTGFTILVPDVDETIFPHRDVEPAEGNSTLLGNMLRIVDPPGSAPRYEGTGILLRDVKIPDTLDVASTVESCLTLQRLGPVISLENPLVEHATIWQWRFSVEQTCHQRRIRVDWSDGIMPDGETIPHEWDTIVRRIYPDAGRVALRILHGGYTSKAFLVDSYDKEGRKRLPTVLKLGTPEITRAEETGCESYVKPFILNNSTSVLGSSYTGNWGGICYNFLGIGGADSTLYMLREVYQKQSPERFSGLLAQVFTNILKPWYGQPRMVDCRLWEEHDPRLGLFPGLLNHVEGFLGESAGQPRLVCPYLDRTLPNPYHFLATEWGDRHPRTRSWYQSIVHGDLNLQNILLDERDNLYVIDFSETSHGNVVSDFARLEVVVKTEFPRIDHDDDLKDLLQFEWQLQQTDRIDQKPEFRYQGSDPFVLKAYDTIVQMRRYANISTLFETDIVPYYLALLQWTLPVILWVGLSDKMKWYAVYSCGILIERILKLEGRKGGIGV